MLDWILNGEAELQSKLSLSSATLPCQLRYATQWDASAQERIQDSTAKRESVPWF